MERTIGTGRSGVCVSSSTATFTGEHGRYYNLAFLDGHAVGMTRKRRNADWTRSFNRVLEF